MAIVLDGKKVSEKVREELKTDIAQINERLYPNKLHLVIVMVGSHGPSETFVKHKEKVGAKLDIKVTVRRFTETITTSKLRREVAAIGRDKQVHGIVVQLPLPGHINDQKILDAVPTEKDVDVLGYKAAGKFYTNNKEFQIIPSTLAGILRLLHEYGIREFAGKKVVIVGAGKLVGKPAINYFMRKEVSASVFNVRSSTSDKEGALKIADIIISGAGNPETLEFIKGHMIKPGAIIVDAASAKDPKTGKLKGDVDFASVEPVAGYITPNPGGVGPMTVIMIFFNLAQLAKQRLKIK